MWNDIPDAPVTQTAKSRAIPAARAAEKNAKQCTKTVSALMLAATTASKRKTHGRLTIASRARKRSRS